ncbi:MAG: SDR family NAD(P)-dependent oxidoreductase [Pseudomonadota bacterium]
MTMTLAGKTAVVTGAAAGIGRAIVERLAAAEARVIVTDVDGDGALAVATSLRQAGAVAEAHVLDVTDETAIEAVFGHVDATHGLDVVVNNAGFAFQAPMVDTDVAAFRRIVDVNVLGVFLGMRTAARLMLARGTAGRIVNMASVSGLRGSAGRIAYGATKAAVVNMTQVAAVELGPTPITVNAIAPGPVETPLIKRMHTPATRAGWARHVPQRRYAEPAEIAGVVVYLASDEAGFTTGQVVAVDGGFQAAGMIFDIADES